MPYDVDSPPEVARKYKPKCQRAFVHAFNSVYADTKDDGKAMAAGHAAARRCEGKQSAMNDVRFNITTGLLKAYEGGDGVKRLRTTASSTVLDLGGDEMELSALKAMAITAQQNMTIFLNHKYQVPEDVLGSVEAAAIKDAGGVWDLDFDVRVEDSNPRAVSTWTQIQNGTKLGCSIGARIPEGGYEKTNTGLKIKDIQLMEASIVGIPANPRSFVQHAFKALHAAEQEEEPVTTESSATTINLNLGEATTVTVGEDGPETVALMRNPRELSEAELKLAEADPPAEFDPATAEVVDETGEDDDEERKGPLTSEDFPGLGPETTTTESDVTAGPDDESDSAGGDEPSQEASKSVPESDGIDDEDTRTVISRGIETFEALLRASKDELVDARKALADETEARVQAERERDEAKADLKLARDIVERISALPIGRRTSFKAAASEFRTKFAGVYDDDTLKLMERESDGG